MGSLVGVVTDLNKVAHDDQERRARCYGVRCGEEDGTKPGDAASAGDTPPVKKQPSLSDHGLHPMLIGLSGRNVAIQLLPTSNEDEYVDVFAGLRRLTEGHAERWHWSFDLSRLPHLTQALLDLLLRIGKEICARSDTLALCGLSAHAASGPFFESFLRQCRDEGIALAA